MDNDCTIQVNLIMQSLQFEHVQIAIFYGL